MRRVCLTQRLISCKNEGGDSLFPYVVLSRLGEFLEWMLSSGRRYWAQDRGNRWNVMAFVIEEVTRDDLMVPSGLKPDDSPLMLPC